MKTIAFISILLSGCTPYIAAQHISDPGVRDDGYNYVCIGAKHDERLELKGGYCKDVNGWNLIELRIEYNLIDTP